MTVDAWRKATVERRRREEVPKESLELNDVWMERTDVREAVVRRTGDYLEGGRFHPRQAGSSSQIAASLTVVAQNRTAAQGVEDLHSWVAAACTARPRGPRRLGHANCRLTSRMDHAPRNRMELTLAEGFGLDVTALPYSMAAVVLGGTAGKATGQGRRTRIARARRAEGVGRVARAATDDSRILRTAAAAGAAADEMDPTVRPMIDWLAGPWRQRRRRYS